MGGKVSHSDTHHNKDHLRDITPSDIMQPEKDRDCVLQFYEAPGAVSSWADRRWWLQELGWG